MNATLPIPAASPASNGATVSPVDLVRAMSPEDKQAVFLALLREALEINGDNGLLPIEDEQGKMFGYYVPPKAAQTLADEQWKEMPESVRERFSRPVKDLDNCISSEEMLNYLKQVAGSGSK